MNDVELEELSVTVTGCGGRSSVTRSPYVVSSVDLTSHDGALEHMCVSPGGHWFAEQQQQPTQHGASCNNNGPMSDETAVPAPEFLPLVALLLAGYKAAPAMFVTENALFCRKTAPPSTETRITGSIRVRKQIIMAADTKTRPARRTGLVRV